MLRKIMEMFLAVSVLLLQICVVAAQVFLVIVFVFNGILIRNKVEDKNYLKINGLKPDSHIVIDVSFD